MAAKKKDKNEQAAPESTGALKATAEAIGSALGTIAAKTGMAGGSEPAKKTSAAKPGKLQKKNKQRLPRKEKKKLAKAKRAV